MNKNDAEKKLTEINRCLAKRYRQEYTLNRKCFRYHNLYFSLFYFGGMNAFLIEYADHDDAAWVGRFEDGGLFDEDMPLDEMIRKMIAEIEA